MSILQEWAQGISWQWLLEELCVVVAAMFAITVHESAHGLAAYWLGDDTAKRMKRISLNPFRHIDVFGLLMLAIAKVGWAKPVPVDMSRFKNPKAGMALTALAGPVSNVLLALLASVFYPGLCARWLLTGSRVTEILYYLFYYLVIINAGLAVFNLIPIPPLDGSKLLAIVLPDSAHARLMRYERWGFLVLIALVLCGVLNTPLNFLRTGLMDGLAWLVRPLSDLFISILV